jgi:hypothetical protein
MVAERIKQLLFKTRDGFIIFLFPWFLAFLNSNWIFAPSNGMPDTWFYYAFFRYFDQYAPVFPSNSHYFVERLTWIVPGFYVYKIFPPLIANYVIHLAVYYTAIFSLYGILRFLFNQRTALITALTMGSYPWFLRAAGWDYVDGAGIAYMLLLLLLLTLATHSKYWKIYLFLAGVVHSSMLITNQFWLGFVPAWLAYFLVLNQQYKQNKIDRLTIAAVCFILGNLFISGIMSLFYHSVTGKYNFLENSIQFSQLASHNTDNKNAVISFYGKMFPYWHLLPILLFLAGVWLLRKLRQHIYRFSFFVVLVFFVLSYGWMIFWHYYAIPYLIVFLYSSYLIPATFMLFGALLSTVFIPFSESQFRWVTVFTIVVYAAPFALPSLIRWQDNPYLILPFTVTILAGLIFPIKKWIVLQTLLSISALSFLGGEDAWVYLHNRRQNLDNFLTVVDVGHLIDLHYPDRNYEDFRLWYKSDENISTYVSIASVYLYPWGSAINAFPSKKFTWPRAIPLRSDNIILLSADPNPKQTLVEASRALPVADAKFEYLASDVIRNGNISLTTIFTRLRIPISLEYDEKYEFTEIQGVNWHSAQMGNNKSYAWSGPGVKSDIYFNLPPRNSDAIVEFCILGTILPELPKTLKLFVNGVSIPVESLDSPECPYLFKGKISSDVININPSETLLSFQISRTISPRELEINADSRKLGVAFDWIRIK